MTLKRKLWLGLGILAALSPLGLMLPDHFKAGAAWGEWGADELRDLAGYVPQGLEKLAGLWNAPIPDYAFRGWEGRGLPHLSVAYIVSAMLGIAVTAVAAAAIGFFLGKKGNDAREK